MYVLSRFRLHRVYIYIRRPHRLLAAACNSMASLFWAFSSKAWRLHLRGGRCRAVQEIGPSPLQPRRPGTAPPWSPEQGAPPTQGAAPSGTAQGSQGSRSEAASWIGRMISAWDAHRNRISHEVRVQSNGRFGHQAAVSLSIHLYLDIQIFIVLPQLRLLLHPCPCDKSTAPCEKLCLYTFPLVSGSVG
uniref:Predicted protein n=1 Tax=Hordeum vulgare subsp. vulgare TaxID=112509 RepID=F2DRN4_HORVV|nr:predicted protein [Hordeum vulgare subsp. vulgare]